MVFGDAKSVLGDIAAALRADARARRPHNKRFRTERAKPGGVQG
jgi:hypothetical protein